MHTYILFIKLSIPSSNCLSLFKVSPSVYLSIYLSSCLSVCLSVHLSIYLSIYDLYIYLSIQKSDHKVVYINIHEYQSHYLRHSLPNKDSLSVLMPVFESYTVTL